MATLSTAVNPEDVAPARARVGPADLSRAVQDGLISAAYLLACLKVADHLKSRELMVPAGILATLAVVVPLPLEDRCLHHSLGAWPPGW